MAHGKISRATLLYRRRLEVALYALLMRVRGACSVPLPAFLLLDPTRIFLVLAPQHPKQVLTLLLVLPPPPVCVVVLPNHRCCYYKRFAIFSPPASFRSAPVIQPTGAS